MLARILLPISTAVALTTPVVALTWRCAGPEPNWGLEWRNSLIELKHGNYVIRFKPAEPMRPEGSGPEHRIWVYETQALGSRALPMTLVVQYTGRHAECSFSNADVGHRGHFSGLVIIPGRVLLGCCDWQDEQD